MTSIGSRRGCGRSPHDLQVLMEISYFLFTGSLGALLSILAHSVAYSGLELLRNPQSAALALVEVSVAETLLHLMGGMAMGALYWLSWGLAAVVGVEWWWRGLAYGVVCALGIVLPSLASLSLARREPLLQSLAVSARWLTTCLFVGLACAWQWANG
jgi:hypothetical protein